MLNLDMSLLKTYYADNPNDTCVDVAKKVVNVVFGNDKPLSMYRLLCGKHFIESLQDVYHKEIEYHTAILSSMSDYLGLETKDAINNTMMMIDELGEGIDTLSFVKRCINVYIAQVAVTDASIICANLPGNMTDEQLMNVFGWLKDTYSDRMIVALEKLDMHEDFATRLVKTAENIMKRYEKEPEE